MIRCPHCGHRGDVKDFKLLREPWRFSYYTVKLFECPSCNKKFRYYVGSLPSRRISEFYIPNFKFRQDEVRQRETLDHATTVRMLSEIGKLLGFHVTVEEPTADKLYKYDCIWRDAPDHGPLKVFEVEFRSDVDKALSRLKHAYDLWHPELYLVVADERNQERAEKLVKPLVRGAFAQLRDKLTILSVEDVVSLHQSLYKNKRVREIIEKFSKRS